VPEKRKTIYFGHSIAEETSMAVNLLLLKEEKPSLQMNYFDSPSNSTNIPFLPTLAKHLQFLLGITLDRLVGLLDIEPPLRCHSQNLFPKYFSPRRYPAKTI